MKLSHYVRKLLNIKNILFGNGSISYSQVGEDRIIYFLFQSLKLHRITYLDIGANHPIRGNNTYLFYTLGSTGVCIEPNPNLANKIRQHRPNDICIDKGIGINNILQATYYIYEEDGLNTFSESETKLRTIEGIHYKKKLNLPLVNINVAIESTINSAPDLISLDVEGLDIEILKEYDFSKYAPKVIVVETIKLNNTPKDGKIEEIILFIKSRGYLIYADTFVNTIFCKEDLF